MMRDVSFVKVISTDASRPVFGQWSDQEKLLHINTVTNQISD